MHAPRPKKRKPGSAVATVGEAKIAQVTFVVASDDIDAAYRAALRAEG